MGFDSTQLIVLLKYDSRTYLNLLNHEKKSCLFDFGPCSHKVNLNKYIGVMLDIKF